MKTLMIYGATGYTGRMAAVHAKAAGLDSAARRVLDGERQTGFATPGQVFGAGFAETIAGTTITDF
ncbi:hypothetical protein [Pseudomonas prosekii]|uniref:Saccharopine dehydrogenase n=1 Tax=Pseudomonas prosekii TaxID=1148509 RepID=A0A1H1N3A7_9PSED|nr:hypothetical protein [Pseudomonas prosekii]SDR92669.1 hypothetical protein SAMN05216222_0313 [Pseudomonas prosekii]